MSLLMSGVFLILVHTKSESSVTLSDWIIFTSRRRASWVPLGHAFGRHYQSSTDTQNCAYLPKTGSRFSFIPNLFSSFLRKKAKNINGKSQYGDNWAKLWCESWFASHMEFLQFQLDFFDWDQPTTFRSAATFGNQNSVTKEH